MIPRWWLNESKSLEEFKGGGGLGIKTVSEVSPRSCRTRRLRLDSLLLCQLLLHHLDMSTGVDAWTLWPYPVCNAKVPSTNWLEKLRHVVILLSLRATPVHVQRRISNNKPDSSPLYQYEAFIPSRPGPFELCSPPELAFEFELFFRGQIVELRRPDVSGGESVLGEVEGLG